VWSPVADRAPQTTLASLTAHLAGQGVMKQKWPERLELMGTLPRNLAGKVIKADLRSMVVCPSGARPNCRTFVLGPLNTG
jgi:non-ribosomal peptide synthetase component E (peptide arylation enzyme)